MTRLVPILCVLASLSFFVPLAVWVEHRRNRKAKPHPLAPVIPLPTHYVRVVPEPRRRWEA